MYGWKKKLLRVDLSTGTTLVEEIDENILHQYLGGRGLGTYLVYTEVSPDSDPLGPENILAFCTGSLTGVRVPTGGRSSMSTLSPLTGTIFDANAGSQFGVRLHWAGYDALVITGQASSPVWLDVTAEGAKIHSADHLWGQEIPETVGQLKSKGSAVVSIGPAGENQVLFASIADENGRSYGRGGVGAVMGSKNLKAIVAHGKDKPEIANKDIYEFVTYEAGKMVNASPRTSQGLPEFGTAVLVNLMNWYGVLPTHNFQKGEFAAADKISGERLRDEFLTKRGACWSCPIGCKRNTKTSKESGEGPEYETIYALGSSLGIDDFETIIEANYLCNRLGMDTISCGATIACAMELAQRDLLDTELAFGRVDLLLQTIIDIANRQNIGGELAVGSKRLAEKYQAPEIAMQVKGLEFPAYDPRGMQGQGLLYATSNRGACHLRGNMLGPELLGAPKMLDRHAPSGKAGILIVMQHTNAVIDSIGMCKFVNFAIGDDFFARLMTSITGVKYEVQDLQLAGERIWNLERLYNLRAGFSSLDDTLPPRFLELPLEEGGSAGYVVHLDEMLVEYYRFRGWDSEGVPTERKLSALGLEELGAQFMEERSHA
ncbi:MAG: aldehyde ferredoxin oxidoreductase family protein [Anaerolineales bacterium]|nr:aldehyde ferredoxin oxidoreductase family protein [Anaerolineales bacterium]